MCLLGTLSLLASCNLHSHVLLNYISDSRELARRAQWRTTRAFRPGTVANHRSHILLFIAFALYFSFNPFPAEERQLLLFGEFLLRGYSAPKSVLNVFSSLRRFHSEHNFQVDGFDSVPLSRWKRALFLTVRTVPHRASPFPFQLLERLCSLAESSGPGGHTMAAFLTVAFHVCARASTLLSSTVGTYDFSRLPTLADVVRDGEGFSLFIKWDKTRQVSGQGFFAPLLPAGDSRACPVRALNGLLSRARGLPQTSPLFATVGWGRGGPLTTPLTIARARAWLRALLQADGVGARDYTLHSLRRGGCTLAFAGGAAVSDLQSLGGWRSGAVHIYHSQFDAGLRAAEALRSAALPVSNL